MSNERGFTLMEALIVMSIFGTLMMSAVPSFSGAIDRYQVRAEADRLQTMIKLARVTAIQNLQRTRICPSVDQATCDDSADADWSNGFVVLLDEDDDGTYTELVQVVGPMGDGSNINLQDNVGNTINSLTFRSIGVLEGTASASFQLRVPDCEGLTNRDIAIGFNGVTSASYQDCASSERQQ